MSGQDNELSVLRSRVRELETELSAYRVGERRHLEREERLERICASANDGIFIVDPVRDEILEANPRAAEIVGYSVGELTGMRVSAIHPDEMPLLLKFSEGVFDSGSGITDALTCLTKKRRRVPVEMSASALTLGDQRLMLVIIRDITERLEAEKALREAFAEISRLKDRLQAESEYLQEEIKGEHNFEEIITDNESLKKALRRVNQVAATDATVLILGESGTGKELVARAVHSRSRRVARPLVKVNCSALPANLIESELFGHERGAFSGAQERRIGRFELADGGTVFLDEIGDLPLELQPKLLRVLQEREFERLGSSQTLRVDVRVIAATNRNLDAAVAQGTFREDLYYRINVFPILCPPLRSRKDDIQILVRHFVRKYASKLGRPVPNVPERVVKALESYDWPGNVRELENVVERAMIISLGTELDLSDWLPAMSAESAQPPTSTMEDVERRHIQHVLESVNWKVRGEGGAASVLGLRPTTLEARMKKLGIGRPQ